MPSLPGTFAEDVVNQPARAQFEAFLDEHREALGRCLDGLTEEQARRSLVPSGTTLLGLVTTTPSPASGTHTARRASRRGVRRHRWGWTTRSPATGAARARCAGCTCTCCANSPSTAGTQTS